MRLPWRKPPARDWVVEDTGASEARARAEQELEAVRERTQQVRARSEEVAAETAQWRRLRDELYHISAERNGLAEAFLAAAYRNAPARRQA